VLAILPLEDALTCAAHLRQHYLACFAQQVDEESGKQIVFSTLSGAIEYAHIKIPLTKVLFDAHHLLDEIAKEKTGRDSIAVRIQKPSGLAVEWSQPWAVALDDNGQLVVETLAAAFCETTEKDATFSSKFFYKIRERFDVLNPVIDQQDRMKHQAILSKEEAIDLMCMEYLNSGKTIDKTMTNARQTIQPLLEQCRCVTRHVEESTATAPSKEPAPKPQESYHTSDFLQVDAALLVRFLANKGIES